MREYLGFDRAMMVFGTSVAGGFAEKVKELCTTVNEGGNVQPLDAAGRGGKRRQARCACLGALGDANPGKLILFGQSKTGTSWPEQTTHPVLIDLRENGSLAAAFGSIQFERFVSPNRSTRIVGHLCVLTADC